MVHVVMVVFVVVLITVLSFPILYISLELPKRIINEAIGGTFKAWSDLEQPVEFTTEQRRKGEPIFTELDTMIAEKRFVTGDELEHVIPPLEGFPQKGRNAIRFEIVDGDQRPAVQPDLQILFASDARMGVAHVRRELR